MHELIKGLEILHLYTESVIGFDGKICVNIEGCTLKPKHIRELEYNDWRLEEINSCSCYVFIVDDQV